MDHNWTKLYEKKRKKEKKKKKERHLLIDSPNRKKKSPTNQNTKRHIFALTSKLLQQFLDNKDT